MGKRMYIKGDLYYEDDQLFENEGLIPIEIPRCQKILKLLIENANKEVSYDILYKKCFRSTRVEEYDGSVIRAVSILRRKHAALKDCIQQGKRSCKLLVEQPLQLIPLFSREQVMVDGAFPPCLFHESREDVLAKMGSLAFKEGQAFLIYGPPGIGKTELARDFARKCCRETYRYRYVLSVKYKENLRETIISLPTEETAKTEKQYEAFLEKLEQLQKQGQVLLIIDNMDIDEEAFARDQDTFDRLCRMGLHMLFTSRSHLNAYFAEASVELTQMPLDTLENLFRRAAGDRFSAPATELRELIAAGLHCNTYLVVLAGVLMRSTDFDTLKKAILREDSGAAALREQIRVRKDGELKTGTLMEHFEALYQLQTMDTLQRKIMSIFCMLPLDGIDRRRLLERGFGSNAERNKAGAALDNLLESFWVIRNDGGMLCLHPMVREMMLTRYFQSRDICAYVEATSKALYEPSYSSNLMPQLILANAAYCMIEKRKLDVPEAAFLVAQIASAWDTLTDYKKSCDFGLKALPMLDAVERKEDAASLYWLAVCYSVVGNGLNHARSDKARGRAAYALKAAEALVDDAFEKASAADTLYKKLTVLRSKIRSNLAGNYLACGRYGDALACHQAVLADRQALLERNGGEAYQKMVAASYKNIGTVQYYLAEENLTASFESHCKAVAQYREAEEGIKSDMHCVAIHRALGSMLCIVEMCDGKKFENLYHMTVENQLLSLLNTERTVMEYLVREAPIANELANGFGNTCKILFLAHLNGIHNAEMPNIAEDIWRMQSLIPDEMKKLIYPAVMLLGRLI